MPVRMLMRSHACSPGLLRAASGFAETSGLTPPASRIADWACLSADAEVWTLTRRLPSHAQSEFRLAGAGERSREDSDGSASAQSRQWCSSVGNNDPPVVVKFPYLC